MSKKATIIIDASDLEEVEAVLQEIGVFYATEEQHA